VCCGHERQCKKQNDCSEHSLIGYHKAVCITSTLSQMQSNKVNMFDVPENMEYVPVTMEIGHMQRVCTLKNSRSSTTTISDDMFALFKMKSISDMRVCKWQSLSANLMSNCQVAPDLTTYQADSAEATSILMYVLENLTRKGNLCLVIKHLYQGTERFQNHGF